MEKDGRNTFEIISENVAVTKSGTKSDLIIRI